MHTCVDMRPEVKPGCCSSGVITMVWLGPGATDTGWLPSEPGTPVSASLARSSTAVHAQAISSGFWELTQVFTLVWHTSYSLSHLPSPQDMFLKEIGNPPSCFNCVIMRLLPHLKTLCPSLKWHHFKELLQSVMTEGSGLGTWGQYSNYHIIVEFV